MKITENLENVAIFLVFLIMQLMENLNRLQKPCGFFLINKPAGKTSFWCCARVRKAINIKKVGHTGTLDPFATGLLVIAVGKATKFIPYLEKAKKTYTTTVVLGKTTETLDTESEIVDVFDGDAPELPQVKEVLASFLGEITQIPPKFSALKINGQRAYKLAREGREVVMKPRKTEVFDIQLLEYDFPRVKVKLTVKAGFYVRTFADDLAKKLGTNGGYCAELRRDGVGALKLADAEEIDAILQPIDPQFIVKTLPQREITTGRLQDFWEGRSFPYVGEENDKYLMICNGKSIGLGEMRHGKLQPRVVL